VSRLLRRTLYGIAGGVLLYVAAMIYFGLGPVQATLRGYPWWVLGVAVLLSSVNYALRFAKWELALGWLAVRDEAPGLTRRRSAVIYLAGLSMSVTPGKLGEVLRSLLLRASDGVPVTRTAPVVLADRLTDLVALVVLSLIGVARFREYLPVVGAAVVFVVAGIVIMGSPRLLHGVLRGMGRLPGLGQITHKAQPLVESTAVLLRVRGLAVLSVLSVVGWGLECVGFWLGLCTFLWAAGTLAGALSFLPGGLGVTEGSLIIATTRLIAGVTQPIAMAAALLGRIATLWYGELVGGIALAVFLRDPELRAKAMAESPKA
jgi:uncharacterized membrane protein YbhN (UPF0104 family)